jgi:hypothetical protein
MPALLFTKHALFAFRDGSFVMREELSVKKRKLVTRLSKGDVMANKDPAFVHTNVEFIYVALTDDQVTALLIGDEVLLNSLTPLRD